MMHQLSGGAWGVVIRRPIGAASRVLPVMTVPLPADRARHVAPLHHGRTPTSSRATKRCSTSTLLPEYAVLPCPRGLYFLVWNALSYFLNAWSLEQDRTADPRIARRMQTLSAGGLVAYGLTITFASFDWLMSLEPALVLDDLRRAHSSAARGSSALAFLIAVLVWLSRRPPLDRIVVPAHFHDLGNLLLAFVDAVGVLLLLAVPDHLGRQSPRTRSRGTSTGSIGWRSIGARADPVPFRACRSSCCCRARSSGEPQLIGKLAVAILVVRGSSICCWLIAPDSTSG